MNDPSGQLKRREQLTLLAAAIRGLLAGATRALVEWLLNDGNSYT
jgi:hypothetical protein